MLHIEGFIEGFKSNVFRRKENCSYKYNLQPICPDYTLGKYKTVKLKT